MTHGTGGYGYGYGYGGGYGDGYGGGYGGSYGPYPHFTSTRAIELLDRGLKDEIREKIKEKIDHSCSYESLEVRTIIHQFGRSLPPLPAREIVITRECSTKTKVSKCASSFLAGLTGTREGHYDTIW